MKKQIFRQSVLDRLSSPEQLDLLFQVVRPASWAALGAFLLLLGTLVLWGFFGTVTTLVTGQGILLRQGALEEASSPGTGQVETILVDVDDRVEPGQLLARLAQPELRNQIAELRGKLELLRVERSLNLKLGADRKSLEAEYLTRRRRALQSSLAVARERAEALKEQLERYDALYRKKFITRSQYLDVKGKHSAALQDILSYREELARVPMTAADSTSQREQQKIDVGMRLLATEKQLAALEERLERESVIRSPARGRVLEIFKDPGEVIAAGEDLLSVENEREQGATLYVQAYVQPQKGKRIQPGMEAQIAPSVVKQEEFGVLRGWVLRVSPFPASVKGMLQVLGNEQLVQTLSQGGSPITVTVALEPSKTSLSGYVWSSGDGPPVLLQSGTLCTATVVVQRQAPATLVLPFLKKFFLGVGEPQKEGSGDA